MTTPHNKLTEEELSTIIECYSRHYALDGLGDRFVGNLLGHIAVIVNENKAKDAEIASIATLYHEACNVITLREQERDQLKAQVAEMRETLHQAYKYVLGSACSNPLTEAEEKELGRNLADWNNEKGIEFQSPQQILAVIEPVIGVIKQMDCRCLNPGPMCRRCFVLSSLTTYKQQLLGDK